MSQKTIILFLVLLFALAPRESFACLDQTLENSAQVRVKIKLSMFYRERYISIDRSAYQGIIRLSGLSQFTWEIRLKEYIESVNTLKEEDLLFLLHEIYRNGFYELSFTPLYRIGWHDRKLIRGYKLTLFHKDLIDGFLKKLDFRPSDETISVLLSFVTASAFSDEIYMETIDRLPRKK